MSTKQPALDAGLVKRGEAAPAAPPAPAEAAQKDKARGIPPVVVAAAKAGELGDLPPMFAAALSRKPEKVEHRATKRPTPKDLGYHMQSVRLSPDEYKLLRHVAFALDKSYQEIYSEALRVWLETHIELPGVREYLQAGAAASASAQPKEGA